MMVGCRLLFVGSEDVIQLYEGQKGIRNNNRDAVNEKSVNDKQYTSHQINHTNTGYILLDKKTRYHKKGSCIAYKINPIHNYLPIIFFVIREEASHEAKKPKTLIMAKTANMLNHFISTG